MFPILIDFGTVKLPLLGETHLFLPTYGILFAAGALAAWWWFQRRAERLSLPKDAVFNLAFYTLLAGIVGAKLALLVVEWRYYLEDPSRILGTIRSAGVLMGGVLCGAVVFVAYCRAKRLPLFELGDAIAPPLALAQGIGRIGCLAAGCCYGREWHGPLAITFTNPDALGMSDVTLGVPRVPTQILQMAADLGLALILARIGRRRGHVPGNVFWWYMVIYGITRGSIEFFRGDAVRGLWLGGAISTSQILSVASIAIGSAMLWRSSRRREAAAA